MAIDKIKALLLAFPEVEGWPDLKTLIARSGAPSNKPCWEYPLHACRAVGCAADAALPGAAAIFCMLHSLHLIDDLLDEEPDGLHQEIGIGRAANLAAALQALAQQVFRDPHLDDETRARILDDLAAMTLTTAWGQSLDVAGQTDEEAYWRAVETKTPPLFSSAFFIGALLGGGSLETARHLGKIGAILGRIIQVSDDLKDAMTTPAGADWRSRGNNLPILYALTADYPQRARFEELLEHVDEPEALEEAQDLLVRCGAFGFCAYKMLESHRQAHALLREVSLVNPQEIRDLLDRHSGKIRDLFQSVDIEPPPDLFEE